MTKPTITLVDDDRNILTSLEIALEVEGYKVQAFDNGPDALESLRKKETDLVVLDMKMPVMDGLEVLRHIREFSDMPAMFLTSVDDEIDQVLGLRMGADDYVTKPFSQRVLMERIKGVLRRAQKGVTVDKAADIIDRGDLRLDETRHLCTWKTEPVTMTVTEYLLVKALALKPGHVKNRDQLIDEAYGENIYVDDRTVDSHIKRIRQKFRKIDKNFNHIETVYGLGYRYKEDV
jgi:two-component system response regulator ChvI